LVSRGPKDLNSSRRNSDASKKGEESCQEEKEVAMERSQVSVNFKGK
jgi:hypothetical protein